MPLDLLPLEIFNVIATYLTNTEALTCQTVCSLWYKKWIAYKYNHVHIKGKLQFQAFFVALQYPLYKPDTPFSLGYQVRKLIVEEGHITPCILGQLPILCPYLEALMFDGVTLSEIARKEPFQHYQQKKNKEELDKVKQNFSKWTRICHIAELNGITISLALLQLPTNLVSISVQFNNQNDRTNSKVPFLRSLYNAPFLQSFSVERVYFSMEELEIVHASCPNLKSLHLTDTVLLPIANWTSSQIEPANLLESFHFINGSFCDGTAVWLDYISRKYLNAKTINIGTCSFSVDGVVNFRHINDVSGMFEPQLAQITKSCLKLRSLNLQPFSVGTRFFKNLDQNGIRLEELTIGDGRTMSLATGLKGILNSWQQGTIQRLTVHGWPLTSDLGGLDLLTVTLNKCINITSLNLCLGRRFYRSPGSLDFSVSDTTTLHFDLVLQACPRLTNLSVMDAKITASDFFTSAIPGFALEALRFENVLIDSSSFIFQIISSYCRRLKSLSLISTIPSPIYHNTRNFNIYLPHHHLQMLVLDRVRVSRKCNTRLGTSTFKLTSSQGVIWYDLTAYECCNDRHSMFNLDANNVVQTYVGMHTGKMRARKVRRLQDEEVSYSKLDQTAYVSVFCKDVDTLHLSGLHII